MSDTPVIVNPHGQPARVRPTDACPDCGKGKEARQTIHAFGSDPYQACTHCGHEFKEGLIHGR